MSPLGRASIGHVAAEEWAGTVAVGERLQELEDGITGGCPPWVCRGDEQLAGQDGFGLAA